MFSEAAGAKRKRQGTNQVQQVRAQDYKSNLEKTREVERMAKITRDMTIAQILSMDMETAKIFMESGMHCVGCPASSGESLEQASAVHGMEVDTLLKKLNDYFGE